MSKERAKGTSFESALVPFLRVLWPSARRTGSENYGAGDFANTWPFLIEAKNRKDMKLGEWVKQAEMACARLREQSGTILLPAVIHKRRFYGTHRAYVTMPLESWVASLINAADIPEWERKQMLDDLLELTPSDEEALRLDPFVDAPARAVKES